MKFIRNKLLKETFWSFLSKGVTFFLFFFINILLARKLSVTEYGNWSYFLSIITIIFTLSYFGVNSAITRFLAEHNKKDTLRSVIRDGIIIRIYISFGFLVLFSLAAYPLSMLLERNDLLPLFFYSLPLIFFSGSLEFLKDVFIGLHRAKFNFILNFLEFGIKSILVFAFLTYFSYESSIPLIITAYTIALVISSVIGAFFLLKNFFFVGAISKNTYVKEIFSYSLPLFFVSIGFLLLTEIDSVMLGTLSTVEEVGIYAVAKQITTKMPHIAVAISMGTMPVFAKLTQSNKKSLQNTFLRLLALNGLIFGAIYISILLFADLLIPLLFGEEYIDSILVLYVLSIYMVLYSFSIFFAKFLDYRGLAKKRAQNIIITILANIILNYLLIPRYGALGASIATTISYTPYIFLNVFETIQVFRKLQ